MKHNISPLKAKLMFNDFYEGLLIKKNKEQENNERDSIYNIINKINDKIQQQQERSIE